jgi:hypothetical protein
MDSDPRSGLERKIVGSCGYQSGIPALRNAS